jgi:hypothetical protein
MKTRRRNYSAAAADFGNSGNDYSGSPVLPFLDLAIDEMQQTRHWAAHHRNVMGEQRQSNRQHPNAEKRERQETEHSGNDEGDTGGHPHPYCAVPPQTVQTTTEPARDVVLEAVYFLVEIGYFGHPRSGGVHSVYLWSPACRGSNRQNTITLTQRYAHAKTWRA